MTEAELIALLRTSATDPAARGLADDAAVLPIDGAWLVFTHDMLVEGVHYLPDDPPGDVAWKLLAVNLSDLSAKGAVPVGVLLGFMLGDDAWDRAFVRGLHSALAAFAVPLLGGDTVAGTPGSARALGLTAIGQCKSVPPSRSGARPGDRLWVSGAIGDSGVGLELLRKGVQAPAELIERYRKPRPRLEAGQRLAPLVGAMMDVSDGLLIDASRMGQASGCAIAIALDSVPLSQAYRETAGDSRGSRLRACTAGDDYELLFSALPEKTDDILALAEEIGLSLTPIGDFDFGDSISLTDRGEPVALPQRLGFEHQG